MAESGGSGATLEAPTAADQLKRSGAGASFRGPAFHRRSASTARTSAPRAIDDERCTLAFVCEIGTGCSVP
jgi:hypothetical protein